MFLPRHSLLLTCTVLALGIACTEGNPETPEKPSIDRSSPEDTGDGWTPADSGWGDTGSDAGDDQRLPDDARIVESNFPTDLDCGETTSASVTVRNVGSATWTRDDGYKLGTVDDEDPFHASTRVYLQPGEVVPPGQTHTFPIQLQAPENGGSLVTDWQMVHEGVQWFGEAREHRVQVSCSTSQPNEPPVPVLADVVWLHSDISGWPQTSTLSSVTFSGNDICMDYDKANQWPIYDASGTDVVANPWIFIYQNSQWYAGTWEWMRPGQTCKSVSAVAGDHIKRAPFDEASGWTPQSGTVYYFMLSGLARWSERTVSERTNLVRVVWP